MMNKEFRRFLTIFWQSSAIGLLLVAVTVSPVVMMTSCTSAQVLTVVTDITKFAPVVTNVLALACTFSPGAALCATGAHDLNQIASDLSIALTTYQQQLAAGTATVSAWNILNAVFATFETQTAAVFDLFHISGAASQAQANAVALSAQTLLSLIEALFPASPLPPAAANAMAEFSPLRPALFATKFHAAAPLTVHGVTFFNLKAWQKDFNKKVDAAKKANPKAVLVHVSV